jgi:putative ABC transport system permease protein
MRLADVLWESFRSISERPWRSVFTGLGSLLGVATVITITGLSTTAVHQVSVRFDEILATRFVVEPASFDDATPLLDGDLDALRAVAGVTGVARVTVLPTEIASMSPLYGRDVSITPVAVSSRFSDALDVTVVAGESWDGTLAGDRGAAVGLMGETLALEAGVFFNGPFTFWVGGEPITVTGIVSASGADARANRWLLVPEGLVDRAMPGARTSIVVRVHPGSGQGVAEVVPHVLDANRPEAFAALVPPAPEVLRGNIEGDTKVAFLLAGGIALVVGAVAIASATLTAVAERTEQYGIRRALGARRSVIARLVMLETVLVGLGGGIAGGVLGMIAILIFSLVLGWLPVFDVTLVPLALGIGAVVGGAAGLLPAVKASRIEPVEALRRI